MKINKWTLGLAAVGLVSLTPALRAAGPQPVTTELSATTISGYVDTSAVWNPGTGNGNPAPFSFNGGKQDGFNLDSVDVKLSKPLDAGQWGAGYTVELMYGPDAVTGSPAVGPIRQAFVSLRAPIGNGLTFQVGQWDNLLGYESTDSYKDPNWTRSYGYTIEPTEHVGVLASYRWDNAMLQVGVANELTPTFTSRNFSGTPPVGPATAIESKKAIVSLLTLTAPSSWGALKDSALYVGVDYGPGNAFSHAAAGTINVPAANSHMVDKTHLYVGTTINTGLSGLSFGAAWDTVNNCDALNAFGVEGYASTMAAYVSYKATDKVTINGRAEYARGSAFDNLVVLGKAQEAKILAFTGTVQYDLWGKNVISRLEVRWDTSADGSPMFGGTAGVPTKNNDLMVAANVIYKF